MNTLKQYQITDPRKIINSTEYSIDMVIRIHIF